MPGAKYFITFVDNTTRFTVVSFLKHKAQAFSAFKSLAENQTNHKIKVIRSDNGGECTSKEWETFCQQHGILHQKSVPYTPQQNGVAERKNRTLLNATRSMLATSKCTIDFRKMQWQ